MFDYLATARDPFEADVVCVHMGCAIQEVVSRRDVDEDGERPCRYVVCYDHGKAARNTKPFDTIDEAKADIERKMAQVGDRSTFLMTGREADFVIAHVMGEAERLVFKHYDFPLTLKPALISYGPGAPKKKPRSVSSLEYIRNAPFDENGEIEVIVAAMNEWGGEEHRVTAVVSEVLGLCRLYDGNAGLCWELSPKIRDLREKAAKETS